ncbi:MAG: hypothetical protein WC483_00450 [Candidatus Paceibacterota bacterium]
MSAASAPPLRLLRRRPTSLRSCEGGSLLFDGHLFDGEEGMMSIPSTERRGRRGRRRHRHRRRHHHRHRHRRQPKR